MSEMQRVIARYQAENEQLHRLTQALQSQVSELQKENQDLTFHQALKSPPDHASKAAAQQRINALVKEIDECIQLLQQ
jgi:predicted RNase H-like nuclease (RuvC/YqgF family)